MFTTYGIIVLVLFLAPLFFNIFVSLKNYQNRSQPIPEHLSDIYPESRYQKWLKYFMTNFKFELLKQLLNAVLILILLFAGVFSWIYTHIALLTQNPDLQVLFFVGVYFFLSFISETIYGYYQTFKIEDKFGFNTTSKKTFWLDRFKGLILSIVFGGGLLYLVSVLFSHLNSIFYLITFFVLSFILVFVNLIYVKWIVPIFNKITPLEDGELKNAIMDFSKKVGYEIGKIGILDASKRSTKLNAYFSGFGKTKQIVLYDTLIQKMSIEEIVAVLAHEVGHYHHKDIITGMMRSLVILAGYLGLLYVTLNIQGFYTAFGFDNSFLGFGLILFMVLLSPLEILLGFLLNYISRKREYLADAYSAKHYKPEAMISALKLLAKNNFSNLTPHPLYVKLMYSHPSTGDRIIALEKFLS
ncbi:MAG: M48 family metallopeptidase [Firmicutes bacterium]|nr:M48 family metallopeptidase [Bacillota bacterium]